MSFAWIHQGAVQVSFDAGLEDREQGAVNRLARLLKYPWFLE